MGSILASAILSEVDTILLDTSKVRWPDAEKLVYLNGGQRQIVQFKPDANVVIDSYKLVAGSKQSLPDGSVSFTNPLAATLAEGLLFIEPIRNMGLTGIVAGIAINSIDKKLMDAANPDWHSATASAVVEDVVYDDRIPRKFYVYPPQPVAPAYIEIAYSALVANVAATGAAINLSDQYAAQLRDYVLHRCYAKDAALSPYNASMSVEYWNMFVTGLGRMDLLKKQYNPNAPSPVPASSQILK